MMRLKRNFFNRNTIKVAQELLGKCLVRKINNKIIKARITETEAYCGTKDLACHASRGLTERTKVMFGPAGFSYVYMIYGMYHCLNIVTEKESNPSAVLIRCVQVERGGPSGPACRQAGTPVAWRSADRTRPGCGG
ncbi:MAG: DNA-3-methyladenine glycosylase, partial [Candidatus Yanofskybacteria bacterium]|nr:DNA-3-methyladenine glycosylase [Candidatus Yanofskybacteria bacterium]